MEVESCVKATLGFQDLLLHSSIKQHFFLKVRSHRVEFGGGGGVWGGG